MWAPQQTYGHTSESHPSRLQQCNRVADSLIGIQLPLATVQPTCWFAYRRVCAVPSSVRMTTNNAYIYSRVGKLPGKTEDYACWKTWASLRLRSKQTQSGIYQGMGEVCLVYIRQLKECHVLPNIRVLGLIRLEFAVVPIDVYCWMTIQSYRAHLQ